VEWGIRRLLLVQLLLIAVVSVPLFLAYELSYVLSLWFGAGIAAINALLVVRCARRDARVPERKPQQSLAAVFICVAQRFVIAALLFAFGLGVLKLPPLALLAGFIAGQLVMVIIGTQQLKQK
jgi:F0F1-type ATP synthase assembly protein I